MFRSHKFIFYVKKHLIYYKLVIITSTIKSIFRIFFANQKSFKLICFFFCRHEAQLTDLKHMLFFRSRTKSCLSISQTFESIHNGAATAVKKVISKVHFRRRSTLGNFPLHLVGLRIGCYLCFIPLSDKGGAPQKIFFIWQKKICRVS